MKPTAINVFLMQQRRSQKEIAVALGLDKSTVSLLLAGKLKLEHRLDEIAALLKISRRKLNRLIASDGPSENKGRAA